jgi:hypothetical protein
MEKNMHPVFGKFAFISKTSLIRLKFTSFRDKSKKCAEQAAAVVCLKSLGLDPHSKANISNHSSREEETPKETSAANVEKGAIDKAS